MLPLCRWLHLNDLEHVTTRGAMALATALRGSALASLEVLWISGAFSRHFFQPNAWPHDPAHDAELLVAEDYESVPFGGVAALAGACDARTIMLEVRPLHSLVGMPALLALCPHAHVDGNRSEASPGSPYLHGCACFLAHAYQATGSG